MRQNVTHFIVGSPVALEKRRQGVTESLILQKRDISNIVKYSVRIQILVYLPDYEVSAKK